MKKTQKIALVTGGSRGLGKNMALSLAQKGIGVILTYNSKEKEALDTVAEIEQSGVKGAALQLDVADPRSLDKFFASLEGGLKDTFEADKIDYLINNAGVGVYANFADTTEQDFDLMLNIHLKSVFFITQRALGILNDGGAIVNVSTGLVRFSMPGYATYATMKGAIETLTLYLAKELGGRGIRANSIAPGAIETDFGGGIVRDNSDVNQYVASQTALGRVGKPDDIGGVVAFLCSEEAKWITAQRIEISGGQQI